MKCEIASWYVLLSKIKTIFCAPKNIHKFLHTHFFKGRGVGGGGFGCIHEQIILYYVIMLDGGIGQNIKTI